MKKFLTLICMITCVFGLTACGSEEELSTYEQQKIEYAKNVAANQVVPMLEAFGENPELFSGYTAEEIEYQISDQYQMNVKGNALITGINSFHSAKETVGAIVSTDEITAEIDDNQIIVLVDVTGENKKAQAEIILSNDMFMVMESASLNPVSSVGEMMGKAALNTLIGMGTVFVVLILICAIISAFGIIPKIQEKFTKKDNENVKEEAVNKAVEQIAQAEAAEVDETDDLELVAVIAAAIAASEGAATTDGFVVRSIRRVNRSRR